MPRVLLQPAQPGSEIPLRRHGGHQNAGGSIVRLQILLHDKAAERVTYYHGTCWQAVGNHADILDIVIDRAAAQRFRSRAASMAAKTYRQRAITLVGEKV
jgi:hypothetical protein